MQSQAKDRNRVELSDSVIDVAVKVAEGNPGAIKVCTLLLKDTKGIDPMAAFGGLGMLLAFDDRGIYGSRIWVLYKDVCGESIPNLVALFRGHQLGQIRDSELFDTGRDFAALAKAIKSQIGTFNHPLAA
jgi:hypothetical protein